MAKYGGGGTDCSLPLIQANAEYAKRRVGGVVPVSDNESWVATRPGIPDFDQNSGWGCADEYLPDRDGGSQARRRRTWGQPLHMEPRAARLLKSTTFAAAR